MESNKEADHTVTYSVKDLGSVYMGDKDLSSPGEVVIRHTFHPPINVQAGQTLKIHIDGDSARAEVVPPEV